MSMDYLQDRIRKLKSPLIVDLSVLPEHIPGFVKEGRDEKEAYAEFCRSLLEGLHQCCAGVRFSFDRFALMGALEQLSDLMMKATELGYYVLLEGPAVMTPWGAEMTADAVFGAESKYPCQGIILSPWAGSDVFKPFLPYVHGVKTCGVHFAMEQFFCVIVIGHQDKIQPFD